MPSSGSQRPASAGPTCGRTAASAPPTVRRRMGTGWFAADAAMVKPGATVAVVGDGAVGLLGVLSAKQMRAERIIAMSRHPTRQKLAREFGATDIVTERGDPRRRRGRGTGVRR